MTQTTAVAPAQEPAFESDSLHIPDSDRRGWWSIACIWIGNSINVSTLMTGAVLGAGLTLWDAFWAAFIGFGIILAYMCFVAMKQPTPAFPPPPCPLQPWDARADATSSQSSWVSH